MEMLACRIHHLCVLRFALIFATLLLVMKFYNDSVIKRVEQVDMVVKATRSTPKPPGCHTFMGVTLPNTKACYPSLGGELPRKQHPFPMTNVSMVVYNRVPKCGGKTTISVLDNLARRNEFTFRHAQTFGDITILSDKQVR